jgi:hypothetical protein
MAGKFKPGDKRINYNGRPKGSPNKTTEEIRAGIQLFVEERWEEVQTIWSKMEDKDKMMFFERMLKFVLPQPIVSLEQFSDDDLQILLRRLEEKRLKMEN